MQEALSGVLMRGLNVHRVCLSVLMRGLNVDRVCLSVCIGIRQ